MKNKSEEECKQVGKVGEEHHENFLTEWLRLKSYKCAVKSEIWCGMEKVVLGNIQCWKIFVTVVISN